MASAVRYRSLIWSILADAGGHTLALASCDTDVPGAVAAEPLVTADSSRPGGSNGPRIRVAADPADGSCGWAPPGGCDGPGGWACPPGWPRRIRRPRRRTGPANARLAVPTG